MTITERRAQSPNGDWQTDFCGETTIEVVEKAEPKMRRIVHLLPAAWAAMLAGPLVSAVQPTTLGLISILVLSVAVGLGVGRGAWSLMSAASDRRVQRLAEELASAADQRAAEESF